MKAATAKNDKPLTHVQWGRKIKKEMELNMTICILCEGLAQLRIDVQKYAISKRKNKKLVEPSPEFIRSCRLAIKKINKLQDSGLKVFKSTPEANFIPEGIDIYDFVREEFADIGALIDPDVEDFEEKFKASKLRRSKMQKIANAYSKQAWYSMDYYCDYTQQNLLEYIEGDEYNAWIAKQYKDIGLPFEWN